MEAGRAQTHLVLLALSCPKPTVELNTVEDTVEDTLSPRLQHICSEASQVQGHVCKGNMADGVRVDCSVRGSGAAWAGFSVC